MPRRGEERKKRGEMRKPVVSMLKKKKKKELGKKNWEGKEASEGQRKKEKVYEKRRN